MNRRIVFVISLFLSFEINGNEKKKKIEEVDFRRPEHFISKIYRSGHYLIYDCHKRHFACVNKGSFEYCQKRRKTALLLKKKRVPCAPLKNFSLLDKCIKNQLKFIGETVNKKFCLNPKVNLLN